MDLVEAHRTAATAILTRRRLLQQRTNLILDIPTPEQLARCDQLINDLESQIVATRKALAR